MKPKQKAARRAAARAAQPTLSRADAIAALEQIGSRLPPTSPARDALARILAGEGTEADSITFAKATIGTAALALCGLAKPGDDQADDDDPPTNPRDKTWPGDE